MRRCFMRSSIPIIILLILLLVTAGVFAKKVTVTWMNMEDPKRFDLDGLVREFNKIEPDIEIKYIYTPTAFDEKLKAMMAAGTPPDIARINDDYLVGYALHDYLEPLDKYIEKYGPSKKEDYIDFFWEWPIVNGHHYIWINGATSRLFYVNEDLFKAVGLALPPRKWESPQWTWDHMLQTAQKLTQDKNGDKVPDIWGVAIFHDTGCEQTWSMNNGADGIYSKDGRKFTLASPKGIEAMQYLADLAYKYKVHPPKALYDQQSPLDLFAGGKLAMFFADTRVIPYLRQNAKGFEYAVRPVPMRVRGRQEGSLDTQGIIKGAKNPESAYKWLKFIASEKGQAIIAKSGYTMGLTPRWIEKYFLQTDLLPKDQDVIVESLHYYTPVPKATEVERARQIYRPKLDNLWNGRQTAEQVLLSVKAEVEKLIANFPDARF